jgi:phage virion morphogenesis protein
MAGVRIEVDDERVLTALKGVRDAGLDLRPILQDVALALVTSTQQRFEAETSPSGTRWPRHAKSTLAGMPAARRADPKLLRDRNRLYSSISFEINGNTVLVGTNVKYGRIHQFGGTVKIPERQQTATFRQAKVGAATKADGTRVGSRWRFAKARSKAKSNVTRTFIVPEHTVTVPARPYLGFDARDRETILAIVEDHLLAAMGEGVAT